MNREQKRAPYLIEAILEFSSGRREARISDLSLGGCYVDSIAPVAQGETIAFDIPVAEGKLLHLVGTVAHVFESNGFGVKFAELSQADTMQILELIKASEEH